MATRTSPCSASPCSGNDDDNRAAVKAVAADDLELAGLALRADAKQVDKVLRGLKLHP